MLCVCVMVPYPTSTRFFIGATARRQFRQGIYTGTITHVIDDEGECLWHVVYPDFDSEDLTFNEMVDAVFYHPLLDTTHDLQLPQVGHFVWYAEQPAAAASRSGNRAGPHGPSTGHREGV